VGIVVAQASKGAAGSAAAVAMNGGNLGDIILLSAVDTLKSGVKVHGYWS